MIDDCPPSYPEAAAVETILAISYLLVTGFRAAFFCEKVVTKKTRKRATKYLAMTA